MKLNVKGQVLIEAIITLAAFLLFITLTAELCKNTSIELQKIRYVERVPYVR